MSRVGKATRSAKNPVKIRRVETNENTNNERLIEIKNVDHTLLVSIVLLVLIGIVMVFSSSYYSASQEGARYHYFRMQTFVALVGFVSMMIVSNINYRYFKRFADVLYLVSIALLIYVLFFGLTEGGATRWIHIPGLGFGFQPSEVAKLAIILFVSKVISSKKGILNSFIGTASVSIIILLCVVLVGIENLSTAIIIAIIGFGILFVASPYIVIFVVLGLAAVGGLVAFLAFFAEGFRGARFEAWLNPFADPLGVGFQTVQSLYAIASGGLFGLGLGQSRQKLGFIPEAHNDIIFSIIAEELGLLGAGLVLFLFGVFLWRALKIAMDSQDLFGSLVATGIAIMIGSQVIINVGVVTNTIPNTGVPLPFISYGGTSLAIMMVSVGILLSISRYTKIS